MIVKVYKAGRCFNGAHRDAGTIVHAVEIEEVPAGFFGYPALCRTEPGIRGYGWAETESEVTCPKCIKKMEKVSRKWRNKMQKRTIYRSNHTGTKLYKINSNGCLEINLESHEYGVIGLSYANAKTSPIFPNSKRYMVIRKAHFDKYYKEFIQKMKQVNGKQIR